MEASDDPGDFYCAHAFFVAQRVAEEPGSAVLQNAFAERLVGFLHVPRDRWTTAATAVVDAAVRHAATRVVVGIALRGLVDVIRAAVDEPPRVLLTGFLQWGSVTNNPTGAFVADAENVDAAVRHAFGDDVTGVRLGGDGWHERRSFGSRDRPLLLEARRLRVDDGAIDGGPRSVQRAMRDLRPHAVLSLGVHARADVFRVEHRAGDGRLRTVDGGYAHDEELAERNRLADNHALARAIVRGARTITARV